MTIARHTLYNGSLLCLVSIESLFFFVSDTSPLPFTFHDQWTFYFYSHILAVSSHKRTSIIWNKWLRWRQKNVTAKNYWKAFSCCALNIVILYFIRVLFRFFWIFEHRPRHDSTITFSQNHLIARICSLICCIEWKLEHTSFVKDYTFWPLPPQFDLKSEVCESLTKILIHRYHKPTVEHLWVRIFSIDTVSKKKL